LSKMKGGGVQKLMTRRERTPEWVHRVRCPVMTDP
jgi:hypothetical protein